MLHLYFEELDVYFILTIQWNTSIMIVQNMHSSMYLLWKQQGYEIVVHTSWLFSI